MSLAAETVPPAKTSGAMKRGVPTAIVPWSSSRAERAGDAEVDEDHAVLAEDHVLRLDVAVHDLLAVHVGQASQPWRTYSIESPSVSPGRRCA